MMTSLLHQLENNEAILLLYLADELSAEDRADVEQQLAGDASMRAELERLRALQEGTFAAMKRDDGAGRLPVSPAVATRRVTRMLHQWQVDHLRPRAEPEPGKELRFPWWSYPLTSAAVILIAFLVWWGNRSERPFENYRQSYEEVAAGPQSLDEWRAEGIFDDLQESFEVSDDELLRMAYNQRVDETVAWLTSAGPAGNEAERAGTTTTN